MIHTVHIRNYRCFPAVDVDLRPLTVLIGKNDTGKSAFLRAIEHAVRRHGFQAADHRGFDTKALVTISLKTDLGRITRRSEGNNEFPAGKEEFFAATANFRLPMEGIGLTCKGFDDSAGPPPLGEKGQNIAAVLDYLVRRDRNAFDSYVEHIRQFIPGLEGLEVSTPSAQHRSVQTCSEREHWLVSAEGMSVGVRIMLFFVALCYHPSPPPLVLLEEPENGVHPGRLGDIVELLRKLTKGEFGKKVQVIFTTHSPYLLDVIKIDNEQVLIFQREPSDGSRTAKPINRDRMKLFLDEFNLGEVWANTDEEEIV